MSRAPDAVQRAARSAAPQSRDLLRRNALVGPGSAAHRFALRSIRGTPPLRLIYTDTA